MTRSTLVILLHKRILNRHNETRKSEESAVGQRSKNRRCWLCLSLRKNYGAQIILKLCPDSEKPCQITGNYAQIQKSLVIRVALTKNKARAAKKERKMFF